jgi:hypothetical protein
MNTTTVQRPVSQVTQYNFKAGKSIVQLAQELENLRENSKDFLVPTSKLEMESRDKELFLGFTNGSKHEIKLNNWSGGQLATYSEIPKAYYDKLKDENPALLATNVNHSFQTIAKQAAKNGEKESRMLRTVNGQARAFVSSKYRRLDSFDLVEAIWPTVQESGLLPVSQELTERRLYLKFVSPDLKTEITKGDVVRYGLLISNSDVGGGSLRVESFIDRLVCSNGLIMPTSMRKNHIQSDRAADDVFELFSDKTKFLTDAAFWSQVKELVQISLRPENFEEQVAKLRATVTKEIKSDDMEKVVEMTMKTLNLPGKDKQKSVLSWLAKGNEGAGLTQWGLINSLTRTAQADFVDYDQAVEIERAAGRIIELTDKEWNRISTAS